jgi:hypothetical protein
MGLMILSYGPLIFQSQGELAPAHEEDGLVVYIRYSVNYRQS